MSSPEQTLRALREALQLSPDNLPLRQHLAGMLLELARYEEAEREYRAALGQAPDSEKLQSGLAHAFYQQGKYTQAMVIVEELMGRADVSPAVRVLYARLLVRAGEVEKAVRQYRQAVDEDPASADEEFAERLGIGAADSAPVSEGRVRHLSEMIDDFEAEEVERPGVNFASVGGMENLKEEIRLKILYPLSHPEVYRAYGKSIGGGILMYGPPGCGKTHLARATAGEIGAGFIAVSINDVLEMWIGNSERNLHAFFEQARRNQPCVLFFDEVDALAASRSDMRGGARQLVNQFLAELDGMGASNEGVLVLAATNAPWHLDTAFRRPGRFDRILFVTPPDGPAREAILRIHCRNKPTRDIDFAQLSKKTDQFSGADLKAVVDAAIEGKLQEAMRSGVPQPLTTRDLLTAASSIKPSTREWFASARNYALYSNQGGLYDDILKYLKL